MGNNKIQRCLNWENMVYDKCRFCTGYKIECKEYLSDVPNHSHGGVSNISPLETIESPLFNPHDSNKKTKPFYFGHVETMHNVTLPKSKMIKLIQRGSEGIL